MRRLSGSITVKPILWTATELANKTHPVKIRITHQRKVKYYQIKLQDQSNLTLSQKEFDKLKTVNSRENRKIIEAIQQAEADSWQSIKQATRNGSVPFSFPQFENFYLGSHSDGNFLVTMKQQYENRYKAGKIGSGRVMEAAYKHLFKFRNGRDFDAADLKPADFKQYLEEMGMTLTSIGFYLRQIRIIYNILALDDSYLGSIDPFRKFKMPTGKGRKGKAFTIEQMRKFIGLKAGEPIAENPVWEAKQHFLFSFYAQGLNFRDMALLKSEDIKKDEIRVYRKKTGVEISIPMTKQIKEILLNVGGHRPYVFGILDGTEANDYEIDSKIRSWVSRNNRWIKKLWGNPEISTYTARHTFASIAKSLVPVTQISKMMGHTSTAITENYLGRFSSDEQRKALMKISKAV